MKTITSSIASWTHGIVVEVSPDGLLLKPKPKPRQNWTAAFSNPKKPLDENASLRDVKNKFDDSEWQW